MARTIDEQKKRYYNLVLGKANEIYASWQTNGIKSKRLVAQANEYAFDNRLKELATYRFQVLAFTVALEIRLKKRYGTFFRRLFYFFAYLRERAVLKILKRVFGFYSNADIREMIGIEVENIIVLLTQEQNRGKIGGGIRAETVEVSIEEELDAFFKECAQEEQKTAENNLDADKVEEVDIRVEPSTRNAEDTKREKIQIEGVEKAEQVGEQKKKANDPTEREEGEKQRTQTAETDIAKNEKIENFAGKMVANTSILAEFAHSGCEKDGSSTSPFPIFREGTEGKTSVAGKGNFVLEKEKNETNLESENGERLDKDIHMENNQEKSPFPVFHSEKVEPIRQGEKVVEKEVKEIKEDKEVKRLEDFEWFEEYKEINPTEQKKVYPQSEISEENKARIALNITMRKEEIALIASQIKAEANIIMQQEEHAWREKISIVEGVHSDQSASKLVEKSQNNGYSKQDLKK